MSQGPARLPHGGEPPRDIAKAGPDWLDLSTGIAPFAYPFAPPPQETWRNLPRQREERAVLSAAAYHFGLGQEGDICLGPGSQALLQLAPELVPAGAAVTLSGNASTSAANTASAMRCETSAAQPETGRGYCASRNVSTGRITFNGSNAPALMGTSGKIWRMAR